MSAASLVARLAEAGTPPELLAAVAERLFTAEVELAALASRRENERQRKARSRDVTGQHVTNADVTDEPSPLAPPLKSTPNPKKYTPPISPQPIVDGARPKFAAPDGVSGDQWKAFRQQRKKALTERAYTLLCNKLSDLADAGWPPGTMIDLAIERGWETVFEPKDQGNGGANRRDGQRMGGPRADPTLELVRAATAAQRQDRGDHGEARVALPSRQFG